MDSYLRNHVKKMVIWTGFILKLISVSAQPQNLVLNPSFENPVNFADQQSPDWKKCLKNDTPDYIEFISRGQLGFYYRNYIGGLLPFDGEAYVGIFCYRTNPLRGVENVREFIQSPLKMPLQKDTLYQISLAVAIDPESNVALNNFNVCFAEEPVRFKKEKEMFSLVPKIRFSGSFYDSISWINLESVYKAKGNESHIILGNFLSDRSVNKKRVFYESRMKQKWNLHELEEAAYYYVDMIKVVRLSEVENTRRKVEKSPLPGKQPLILTEIPVTETIDIDRVPPDSSITLKNIFFDFDESYLLPQSYTVLDQLYEQLILHPEVDITIEGHTDNMGTYEYNMRLSVDRARAVVDYLVEKGISRDHISFEGYGYTRPLSDNRSEAGRQLNRRVAFRILSDKP